MSFIDLLIPSMSLRHKQNKLQDDSPFVVYEYECCESVEVLTLEPVQKNASDLGVDVDHELVSATITYSFKSILKEETV